MNQKEQSNLNSCLAPLLDSLGWKGDQVLIAQALSENQEDLDKIGFLNTMANMNFESRSSFMKLEKLQENLFPCLYIDSKGTGHVLLKKEDGIIIQFDAQSNEYKEMELTQAYGEVIRFTPMSDDSVNLLQQQKNWFFNLFVRFYRLFFIGFILSIILSFIALATPLFIMSIYAQIGVAGAKPDTFMIGVGIALYILVDFVFKTLRMSIFTFISARISYLISNQVMRRILFLPPSFTSSSSTHSQTNRIKDFESIQDFFSGPVLSGFFDLITTFVLLGGMAWIGGSLVYIPVIALAISFIFALSMRSIISKTSTNTSQSYSKKQELLNEILYHFRDSKTSGMTKQLFSDYKKLSLDAGLQSLESSKINNLISSFSFLLTQTAGVATITMGVYMVLEEQLDAGSLLACMLLTWKILSPVKNLFMVITQGERSFRSIQQLDRLMNLPQEVQPNVVTSLTQRIWGDVNFNTVSMKIKGEQHPSLINVSFNAKPGEVFLICGHGGMDGASVIEALFRIRDYQSGSIAIHGMNIRQLDPVTLRKSISYGPAKPQLFDMSLKDNLLQISPNASEEEVQDALIKANIKEDIDKLEDGLNTIVTGSDEQFSLSFKKRFSFAQVYLANTKILCFQQPDQGLTRSRILEFIEEIKNHKSSRTTTIIVSNNRDIFKIADSALWLDQGRIRCSGKAINVANEFYNES